MGTVRNRITSTPITLLSLLGLLSAACLCFAHEPLPFEAGELQRKHAERIANADREHIKALEKLKTKLTKRGDLGAANLVAGMIENTKAEAAMPDSSL